MLGDYVRDGIGAGWSCAKLAAKEIIGEIVREVKESKLSLDKIETQLAARMESKRLGLNL